MIQALICTALFDGEEITRNRALLMEDGRIRAVVPVAEVPDIVPCRRLERGLLAPGFIDLQVNGGGGVNFNDAPNFDGLGRIATAHRRCGVSGFLATIVSDTPDVMALARDAVLAALVRGPANLMGIHYEGPHLNPARAGAHNQNVIRPMDADALAWLCRKQPANLLLTLAPEQVSLKQITTLSDAGVRIAAGHCETDPHRLVEAVNAGLTGATHLFNAMPPLQGRAPGPVAGALGEDRIFCSIIADGQHVAWPNLELTLRAKPQGKVLLVSDAMAPVGTEMTAFELQGRRVEIADGACRLADGTLAGSNLDMATAVRNCRRHLALSQGEALRMASLYPATFLGLGHERGRLAARYRADLVWLDDDGYVLDCWVAGRDMATDGITV